MRAIFVSVIIAGLVTSFGCMSGVSVKSSVEDALGTTIQVAELKNICELPPATPLTDDYVLLGCTEEGMPIVLDLVCQRTSATAMSCAYPVMAFRPDAAGGIAPPATAQ